jgi:hypothetical protein
VSLDGVTQLLRAGDLSLVEAALVELLVRIDHEAVWGEGMWGPRFLVPPCVRPGRRRPS